MFRKKLPRIYTEAEAAIYGARLICAKEGHRFKTALEKGTAGGTQMQYDRERGMPGAACDDIKCIRCDVDIEATYPEIGTIQETR